jgi:Rhs element Vgr protein
MKSFLKVSVELDGIDVFKKYTFKSIEVEKQINKINSAFLQINDGNFSDGFCNISEENLFKCGSKVEIKASFEDETKKIFSGKIIEISISSDSKSSYFNVVCKSNSYKTSLRRKSNFFENIRDSDAFKKILINYKDLNQEIEDTDITHETLIQNDCSDWDFINMRAEANSMIVICQDDDFAIKKIDTKQPPIKSFEFGKDFISIDLKQNSRNQITSSSFVSWNTSDFLTTKSENRFSNCESFGESSSQELAEVNDEKKYFFVDSGSLEKEELDKVSQSFLEFSILSKITGNFIVQGNADLNLAKIIEIKKCSKTFEGKAFISGIFHKIESGNWITKVEVGIEFERYNEKYQNINSPNAIGQIPCMRGLSIGILKKIAEDPKMLNRFFVHIPSIHKEENEGIWCRYLTLSASEKSGIQFFPEIESEVVLGFFNNDPRQAIIMGAMFGKKYHTPKILTEKNYQKAFVTKEQLEISFDDEKKKILINIPGQNSMSISLDQSEKTLEIKNNLNSIKMNENGIEIKTDKDINFLSEGKIKISSKIKTEILSDSCDIEIKGINTKIEGDASVEIKSHTRCAIASEGEAVIRGSVIRLN